MFTINQNLIDDFADKINEKEKKNNKVTSWSSTTTDAHYPSERLVKDSLDSKASLSHTHGNLQNNGQVGSTAQANKNVVTDSSGKITTEDKPTIPSASSTTPSADTTNGSAGTGTTWARSNHAHPKSSLYAEATHTHTQSQITDFPTIPDVSGKENISNKTSSWNATTNHTRYPTEKLVKDSLDLKANSANLSTVATTGDYDDLLNTPDELCIVDFYYDSTTDELVLNTCSDQDLANITGKEDKSNKVMTWSETPNHIHYQTEKLVKDYIDDMIGDIIDYIEG